MHEGLDATAMAGPARAVPPGPVAELIDHDIPPRPDGRASAGGGLDRRSCLRIAALAAAILAGARQGEPHQTGNVAASTAAAGTRWGSYAARVPGAETYLLIALDTTGTIIGHACDNGTIAAWFAGDLSGDAIMAADGAARLHAVAEPGRVRGTLTLAAPHTFTLTPVGAD